MDRANKSTRMTILGEACLLNEKLYGLATHEALAEPLELVGARTDGQLGHHRARAVLQLGVQAPRLAQPMQPAQSRVRFKFLLSIMPTFKTC